MIKRGILLPCIERDLCFRTPNYYAELQVPVTLALMPPFFFFFISPLDRKMKAERNDYLIGFQFMDCLLKSELNY